MYKFINYCTYECRVESGLYTLNVESSLYTLHAMHVLLLYA